MGIFFKLSKVFNKSLTENETFGQKLEGGEEMAVCIREEYMQRCDSKRKKNTFGKNINFF